MFVTMPGSFMPGCRSSIFSIPSANRKASNCSPGIAAGLGRARPGYPSGSAGPPPRVTYLARGRFFSGAAASPIRSRTEQPRSRHLIDDGVAFGMDGAGVEGILSVPDAQETGGLFEGLRPQTGHLLQSLPGSVRGRDHCGIPRSLGHWAGPIPRHKSAVACWPY